MAEIDKNNPASMLTTGRINTLLKDIEYNGSKGASTNRFLQAMVNAVLKQNFWFNENSLKLRGQGARTNELIIQNRSGWAELEESRNRDFNGLGEPVALSEQFRADQSIQSGFQYNVYDFEDTEFGLSMLVEKLKKLIMEEIPVEIEKRAVNKLMEGIDNGVPLINDKDTSGDTKFQPEVIEITFTDDTTTKIAINEILQAIVRKRRLQNSLLYKPDKEKFILLINPEFDIAIQNVGAYAVFGGDKTFQSFLANKVPKFIYGTVPVIVIEELPNVLPALIWPKDDQFNNLALMYMSLFQKVRARVDFIGQSVESKFFKIVAHDFGVDLSYFATKAGIWTAFKDLQRVAEYPTTYFLAQDNNSYTTGDMIVEFNIQAVGDPLASRYRLQLTYTDGFEVIGEYEVGTNGELVSGTTYQLTKTEWPDLGNLRPGSYAIEIIYTDGASVETDLYRTSNYLVMNKSFVPESSYVLGNKKLESNSKSTSKSGATIPTNKNLYSGKKEYREYVLKQQEKRDKLKIKLLKEKRDKNKKD